MPVATVPGFSVTTPAPNAVSITGNGALSYTDVYASPLMAAAIALNIQTAGDVPAGNPGSITIDTNGALAGGNYGIRAYNTGSGAVDVTANGDVTGTTVAGISATNYNSAGTDVTVTTGASAIVTGYTGISATNFGSDDINITANGDVTGTDNIGIRGLNFGGDLNVTTGAGTTVTGAYRGIQVINFGSGGFEITANGDVTGTTNYGIYAYNSTGSDDLTVTTGAGTTVTGGHSGIWARNLGDGLDVTANGDVTGSNTGIYARSFAPANGDLTVTTAAGTTVSGNVRGINVRNDGNGALTVTADGDVTSSGNTAISALNSSVGTAITVTTGAGTTVSGAVRGIYARSYSSGALTVTANGTVTGIGETGIFAQTLLGDLNVTVGADSTVTGGQRGINARNYGGGAVSITANGDVTGTARDGILIFSTSGPVSVAVASGVSVTSTGVGADEFAIQTSGGGSSSITIAGTVTGGAGGAISLEVGSSNNDRLELHSTASVTGLVLASLGTDTLAFGGTGDGTFDLSAIDTGSGTQQYRDFDIFEVDSGTWSFSGTTTASFSITGGTVMGTGTFGGVTIGAGSILAPGNSIGTMTVNGNVGLAAGSIFEVEVNAAGQSDLLVVNGTVSLTGSILRVLADSGTYNPNTNYLIIDNDGADPVTGTFAQITTNLAFLTPTVSYTGGTGNDVVLTLLNGVGPGATSFCSVATSLNQCNAADALQQLPVDNALYLAVLSQTADGAREAFNALSGEIHASIGGVLVNDSRYLRDAIYARLLQVFYLGGGFAQVALATGGPTAVAQAEDPLTAGRMALGATSTDRIAALPAPNGLAFWAQGYGAWGDVDGNGNAASVDRTLGGFVSGMDMALGGSWRVGLATGYAQSNVGVDARLSAADVESYHFAGYLGGRLGDVALRGGGAWTWNEIDSSRTIAFPGFLERAEASYDGDTGQIFAEAALPLAHPSVTWEPFGRLAYVHVGTGGFTESGGVAALTSSGGAEDVGYSLLGLRAATVLSMHGMQVVPRASLGWQYAFGDVDPAASLVFAPGAAFTVFGAPLARSSAIVDAGVTLNVAPDATLGVAYQGQLAGDAQDNAVTGRLDWRF